MDHRKEAEDSAELGRAIGLVMKAIGGDVRQVAESILSKRDHELLGPGEFELCDKVLRAACHILDAAINDRKKRGVPRRQHGLSSLWWKLAPRRVAKKDLREPRRRDQHSAGLLSLCVLRTRASAPPPDRGRRHKAAAIPGPRPTTAAALVAPGWSKATRSGFRPWLKPCWIWVGGLSGHSARDRDS